MKLITISEDETQLTFSSDTIRKLPRNFFKSYETVANMQLFLTSIVYFNRNNFVFFTNVTKLCVDAKSVKSCNKMIFTTLKHLLHLEFNVPLLEQLPFLNENKKLQIALFCVNGVKNVYESLFLSQHTLNYLRLSIGVRKIPRKLFASLRQLHTLIIDSNKCLKLDRTHFQYMKSLFVLKLHRVMLCDYEIMPTIHTLSLNECIVTIYCNFFENLPNLQKLILNCNSIYVLMCTFKFNPKLKYVNLNHNILVIVTRNCFKNCFNLTYLNLSHCNLHNLEVGCLRSCKSLRFLNISHNFLHSLHDNLLSNCKYLLKLNLCSNLLDNLTINLFRNINNLVDLSFENNLLSNLIDGIFANLINLKKLNLFRNHFILFNRNWFDVNNIYVIEILNIGNNLLIETPQMNGVTRNVKRLSVQCNNISFLFANNFVNVSNLIELDLSENVIESIELQTFYKLSQLTTLHLNNNNIFAIESGVFDDLHSLEFIDLSYNCINKLEPQLFRFNRFLDWISFKSNCIVEMPIGLFRNNENLRYVNVLDNPITLLNLQVFQYNSKLKFIVFNELIFNPFFE